MTVLPQGSEISRRRLLQFGAAAEDNQIYVVRANSRQPRKITTLGRNADPVFSPDGQSIYFSSERSGKWQLWRMNLDGSQPLPLVRPQVDVTNVDGAEKENAQ